MKQKRPARRANETAGTFPSHARGAAATAEDWVNQTICRAVAERAGAIHVEPGRDGMTVRLRVGDALRPVPAPKKDVRELVIPRLKAMSRMNVAVEHAAQDGRFRAVVDDREWDCRVSSSPTGWGETIVIRLGAAEPRSA